MNIRSRIAACALATLAGTANAQDLTVSEIGSDGDSYNYYGESGGIHAYSFATTSCNVGNQVIAWFPDGSSNHPVIGQNFFRITDDRIEQLGQSFIKHGFCATNESTCGECQLTPCATLGIGCADTYGAFLNDGANGGRKSDINATTGEHQDPQTPADGLDPDISGRLQVQDTEWNQPGDIYVAEAQYVSEHDQTKRNVRNNTSWREIEINVDFEVSSPKPTEIGDPAIYAWPEHDPAVTIDEVVNLDEGGDGVHGYFFLGWKTTDLGGGLWRYEYAVQNMSSARAGGSFAIPIPCTVQITDLFFRDVDYHSGEVYDNTDWNMTTSSGLVEWRSATTYAQDPRGNALRWGTLYNFAFTADSAPQTAQARLGLYQPGGVNTLYSTVEGPCGTPICEVTSYCTPAVPNSTGSPAVIQVSGSLSALDNSLNLEAIRMPSDKLGYFIAGMGTNGFTPPGSEGLYCLGGAPLVRLLPPALNTGPDGEFSHSPDLTGLPVLADDTWNFQAWFRDQNPGNTSNFTDAAAVRFCP